MNKEQIKKFLISKRGYLKKSQLEVAKAIWKENGNFTLKTKQELNKELNKIREVQKDLRKASVIQESEFEDHILDIYNELVNEQTKEPRLLYFDIEVSPNIGFFWQPGHNISVGYESIIQEKAIICVSYKWSDEDDVNSLTWDNGNDYKLLKKFAEIMNSADVVVGHNSDRFDVKWVRTRCLLHNIELKAKFNSIDILKMARAGFKFNSNRLDYLSKIFGSSGKLKTGYDLWKEVVLNNNKEALNYMVEYCEKDVLELEKVHHKLQKYSPVKKFKFI